jgi:hypothetical protein
MPFSSPHGSEIVAVKLAGNLWVSISNRYSMPTWSLPVKPMGSWAPTCGRSRLKISRAPSGPASSATWPVSSAGLLLAEV